MDNKMVLNMLNSFMASSPESAVKIMVLSAPIRAYLNRELSDEQTKWLGAHIQAHPGAMIQFMNSPVGKTLMQELFALYKNWCEPPQAEAEPPDNFGTL